MENYERFGVRGPDIIPEVFGVSPLILIGIVWGRWPHEERKGAEKSLLQPRCSISEWQNWQKTYIFLTYYHSVCLVYPFRIIKRNLCPVVVNKIMKNLLFINYLCWNLFELSCDLYHFQAHPSLCASAQGSEDSSQLSQVRGKLLGWLSLPSRNALGRGAFKEGIGFCPSFFESLPPPIRVYGLGDKRESYNWGHLNLSKGGDLGTWRGCVFG